MQYTNGGATPDRILGLTEVLALAKGKASQRSIDRWEAAGKFPKRLKAGKNVIGWPEGPVLEAFGYTDVGKLALNQLREEEISDAIGQSREALDAISAIVAKADAEVEPFAEQIKNLQAGLEPIVSARQKRAANRARRQQLQAEQQAGLSREADIVVSDAEERRLALQERRAIEMCAGVNASRARGVRPIRRVRQRVRSRFLRLGMG